MSLRDIICRGAAGSKDGCLWKLRLMRVLIASEIARKDGVFVEVGRLRGATASEAVADKCFTP
jgi:hypothetical protein